MFRNHALVLQYAKFAVVGIASLMVDYVFMVFLTENTAFGLDYFQACAFSYTLSVFVNYHEKSAGFSIRSMTPFHTAFIIWIMILLLIWKWVKTR